VRTYDNHRSGTVPRARLLRRNASGPERTLLRALRESFPHLKWRHQAPVGPYYADILCFSERQVIEVDGDTHASTDAYDTARTAFIAREGYRVTRVANADVMTNLEGVLTQLSFSLREKEGALMARKDEGDGAQKKGGTA